MYTFDILDRVKDYLKITKTDNDVFLSDIIVEVTDEIEKICGQPIIQRGLIMKSLLLDDKGYIILQSTTPSTVLSVAYAEPFSNSYTVISEPDDYIVFDEGYSRKIWVKSGVNKRFTWRVEVSVGWIDAEIPPAIISVAIEMSAMKFKNSVVGKDLLGISSVGVNQGGASSTTSYKTMVSEWKDRLSRYTILGF